MAKNPPKSPSQWMVQVFVPILVALIGAGFWQYFTPDSKAVCQINASDISLEKTVVHGGQVIKVSVRADNPQGQPLLYNWQAVYGQMTPNVRSNSPESTYTAPLNVVDDIISVDITLPDCSSVKKRQSISVIYDTMTSSVDITKITPTLLVSTTSVALIRTEMPVILTNTPEPSTATLISPTRTLIPPTRTLIPPTRTPHPMPPTPNQQATTTTRPHPTAIPPTAITPPTTEPIATETPTSTPTTEPIVTQTNIYNFQVIADSGNSVTISFDYAYDGGVGEVTTGRAIALKGNGGQGSFIGLICSIPDITFKKGFGSIVYSVSCYNKDKPQDSIETGTINIRVVNSRGFTYFEKNFPYLKTWPPNPNP